MTGTETAATIDPREGGHALPTWQRRLVATLIAPLLAGPACCLPWSPLFLFSIFLPMAMAAGYVWSIAPTIVFGMLGDSLVRRDPVWNSWRRWAATGTIVGLAVGTVGTLADHAGIDTAANMARFVIGFGLAGGGVAASRYAIAYRTGHRL